MDRISSSSCCRLSPPRARSARARPRSASASPRTPAQRWPGRTAAASRRARQPPTAPQGEHDRVPPLGLAALQRLRGQPPAHAGEEAAPLGRQHRQVQDVRVQPAQVGERDKPWECPSAGSASAGPEHAIATRRGRRRRRVIHPETIKIVDLETAVDAGQVMCRAGTFGVAGEYCAA